VKQGLPKSRVRSCHAVEEKRCGHQPLHAGLHGPLIPVEVKSRTRSGQNLTSVRLLLGGFVPQTVRLDEHLCPSDGGNGNVAALAWTDSSHHSTEAWETLPGREGWEQAHSQALEGRCLLRGMYGVYQNLGIQRLGKE